jgi:hypothetical protein
MDKIRSKNADSMQHTFLMKRPIVPIRDTKNFEGRPTNLCQWQKENGSPFKAAASVSTLSLSTVVEVLPPVSQKPSDRRVDSP